MYLDVKVSKRSVFETELLAISRDNGEVTLPYLLESAVIRASKDLLVVVLRFSVPNPDFLQKIELRLVCNEVGNSVPYPKRIRNIKHGLPQTTTVLISYLYIPF